MGKTNPSIEELQLEICALKSRISEMEAGNPGISIGESTYRGIIMNMSEGMALDELVFDGNGSVTDWIIRDINPSYEKLMGLKRELVLNRKASEIYGRKEIKPHLLQFEEAIKAKETLYVDVYFSLTKRHFRSSISPLKKGMVLVIFNDITLLIDTERALRKSEETYRTLINSINEGIWQIDKDNITSFVNPALANMLGYTKEEMIGKHLFDFMDEASIAFAQVNIERRKSGIIEQHEFELKTKSGDKIQTLLNTSPVFDEKGRYAGAIAGVTDISTFKSLERDIKDTKDFYESILETVNDGIWVADENDVIYYANSSMEAIAGVPLNQIVNRNVLKNLHDETTRDFKTYYLKARESGEPVEYHARVITPSGKKAIQYGWLLPLIKDDCIKGIICTIQDITDRVIAEETVKSQLAFQQHLIETIPNPVFYKDRDGKYMGCNEAFLTYFGKKRHEVIGKTVFEVSPKEIAVKYFEKDNELWENPGTQVYDWQVKSASDGTVRDVIFNKATWKNEKGRVAGLVGVMLDITERKKMELEKLEANERFKMLFENMGDGVAIYEAVDEGRDFFFVDLNRNGEILSKVKIEEIRGKMVTQVFPGIEEMGLLDVFRKTYLTGKSQLFPLSQYKDQRIEQLVENYVYKLPNNQIAAIYSDITERMRTLEDLESKHAELDQIFEATPDAIIYADKERRIVTVNSAFTRMFGYSPFEVMGRSTRIIYISNEDFEMQGNLRYNINVRESYDVYETMFQRKDGSVFMCEAIGTPVRDAQDSIIGLLSIIRDVTDRKKIEQSLRESEEKFRTLFLAMNEGVALHELVFNEKGKPVDYRIIEVNQAFEKILNLKNKDVAGKLATEAYRQPDVPFLNVYAQVASSGKSTYFDTFYAPLNKFFSISAFSPGKNKFATVFSDITAQKLSEQELLSSREQVRNLVAHMQAAREEERTSIAREIHDELGALLTAFKMDLSWLRLQLGEKEGKIENKFSSMNNLLDATVNTVSRISSELRPSLLDDLGLIPAIEWQIEEFINRTGIQCEFKKEADEIEIDIDRSVAIFRILQEALSNVMRHSGAKEVKVKLSWDADRCCLMVQDNGNGFSVEKLNDAKSFGLIGMKERARFLNGSAEITSKTGHGVKIVAIIPRRGEMPAI